MKDSIERISGNAFRITLKPETREEERINKQKIEAHYHDAIRKHLGDQVKPASLTPDDLNPFQATVELMTVAGTV